MDDVITLVDIRYAPDLNGVTKRCDDIRRTVFCGVESISRSEYFEAGRLGLQPEFQMVVSQADYHGERLAEYHGKRYAIYRTYPKNTDKIELYVQEEAGAEREVHGL